MTCNHFPRQLLPPPDTTAKWRDLGVIDAVKAILIANG
jgi:hypothetical protein